MRRSRMMGETKASESCTILKKAEARSVGPKAPAKEPISDGAPRATRLSHCARNRAARLAAESPGLRAHRSSAVSGCL
jgi:hypothetical protein